MDVQQVLGQGVEEDGADSDVSVEYCQEVHRVDESSPGLRHSAIGYGYTFPSTCFIMSKNNLHHQFNASNKVNNNSKSMPMRCR